MAYNPSEKRDSSGKWTSGGPHTREMHSKTRKAVNKAVGHKGRKPYGSSNKESFASILRKADPESRKHFKAQAKKGKGFYYRKSD